jgi:hypothetical protein
VIRQTSGEIIGSFSQTVLGQLDKHMQKKINFTLTSHYEPKLAKNRLKLIFMG